MASTSRTEANSSGRQVGLESIGKWQPAARRVLSPLMKFFWTLEIEGLENVPEVGGALLCPNHLSVIDSFFVPLSVPRAVTFVGKAEYLDDWKTSKLFPNLGMIPIERGGGSKAKMALNAAQSVIEAGGLFGIYPEGTRTRDGKLHKGHTGAARLAIAAGAPIVPVGIVGTDEVQPPDQARPSVFKNVTIRFGKPIDTTRYGKQSSDPARYRHLTDELMFEIQELSGQEYVHTYAGKVAAPKAEPVREQGENSTRARQLIS